LIRTLSAADVVVAGKRDAVRSREDIKS